MVKDKIQQFDLLIIGSGSGLNAIPEDLKVAVVEESKLGGTCLNRGCIPSKILIHSADVAEIIKNSDKFGLNAKLNKIDFAKIVNRASKIVDESSSKIEKGLANSKNIKLFKGTAKFIAERTVKVGDNIIKAEKVIIAAGARPNVPKIEGLDKINYLTSKEALRLTKQPKTLTIIGGGYIAVELAHFFGSLGTKVNLIERGETLVSREDSEIAKAFTDEFRKKHNVLLGYSTNKVWKKGNKVYAEIQSNKEKKTVVSDQLLLATGVKPNSDKLDVAKAGIKTNDKGFIKVNEYLETSAKNVWAIGDIIGTTMLKHGANYESEIVYQNAFSEEKIKANYAGMPHAIFSSPQIAGVGLTEQELQNKKIKYAKGSCKYIKTGMGLALQDDGFVNIYIDPQTRMILGCHIIGEEAATLIHEVIIAIRNNLTADDVLKTIHIHPALNEVIQRAINSID